MVWTGADHGEHAGLVAVVGASSGIGECTARRLAAEGYRVHCVARDEGRLAALASGIGGTFQVADVERAEDVAALAAVLGERGGPLAGLVYTAGVYERARVQGHPLGMWDRTMAVNLRGAMAVTSAVLPLTGPGSHLVYLSSAAARQSAPGLAAYAASKAGLEAFAQTLADEVEPRGVHVHVVAPAATATPMQRSGVSVFQLEPERVAAAVCWLMALPDDVVLRHLSLRAPGSGPFAVRRRPADEVR
jgi:NAD(P)-dependent dehydrogenase (short-subunit alcohol dehydrogenase family)